MTKGTHSIIPGHNPDSAVVQVKGILNELAGTDMSRYNQSYQTNSQIGSGLVQNKSHPIRIGSVHACWVVIRELHFLQGGWSKRGRPKYFPKMGQGGWSKRGRQKYFPKMGQGFSLRGPPGQNNYSIAQNLETPVCPLNPHPVDFGRLGQRTTCQF